MDTTAKFSLIMLAYRSVRFLKAAIDSVKAQTYPNWELVIQDDASTDGTYELALKLAENEPRIKVFQNPTNLGVPRNRAAASRNVTGDLIGHLDADDVLYPYALATMAEFFAQNPDIALAYSDSAAIDVNGRAYSYKAELDPAPNLAFYGWRHFGAYRRSAFAATQGYNEALASACEDGDLFMQIVEKRPFGRVPVVLYGHRSHGDNASGRNFTCSECPSRPLCNYARVWAQHAGFDLATWTKLEKPEG